MSQKKKRNCLQDHDIGNMEMLNDNAAGEANANAEPREPHYASIDFAAMSRKSQRDIQNLENAATSEYAEIKKAVTEERQENGEIQEEIADNQETAMLDETAENVPKEQQEDLSLYSSIN
ncbi:hypothetical protein WMY93_026613 [Mugilogobius chulae]|uniref:Uncharacterized protein n=1 Tax=Mugilogobius chulae TaxID=88201 RepID=A0AAW0NAP1_9GOBI